MSAPADLKALYRNSRLIPFVGAGVSQSVRWVSDGKPKRGPNWGELVDQAARQLDFEEPSLLHIRGTYLQILEYFRIKKASLAPLTNWLYSEMQPPDDALKSAPILSALAALTNCRTFYTTNYDDFLERSLRLNGRACSSIAIEEHMTSLKKDCEVVKFHGDFNHPEGMVLSESDYDRRLTFDTPMDLRFRSDVLGKALLFLGYSFRDQNVAYLFRLVNEKLKALPGSPSGRRAYIIVAQPSDFEIELFRARNIEVIPVPGLDLTAEIAQVLTDVRS